jgi:DNA-binding GntR family transcriptional regulator
VPQAVRARAPIQRRRSSDPGRSSARTLATDLFEEIRSDILHNRLDPGARLMFRDLRERYRSGLSPLREALMRLAAEGLVVLEDHRGFRVAPATRDEMIDIANTLVEIEALAIRMACEKGDDHWEAGIVARFHELSKRPMFAADGTLDEEWEERNVAFHQSLYEACGSPSLKFVCHVLYERHCRYRRLWSRTDNQTRDVAREHELLMKAALSRDATAAIALLRDHRSATLADVVATAPGT